MGVCGRMIWNPNIHQIVDANAYCDDDTLARFNAIYPCEDIDCIGAKDTQEGHVCVIQPSFLLLSDHGSEYQGRLDAEDRPGRASG